MNVARDDNPFTKERKLKPKKNFVLARLFMTMLICAVIGLGFLFSPLAGFIPGTGFIKQKISNIVSSTSFIPGLPLLGGRQNILIMGVDSNGRDTDPFRGTRSDSNIVLSIDPITKTANALSIPRDSKVYVAENNGIDKLNSAHAIGGARLTVKTIEDTFGIKISHYIEIDYMGVKELVEAIGGVPVNVEKRMVYRDRAGGLNIDLYPGYQTLNARQAEGYLRFRHDAIGDIGRMQRQQWFVRGLVKKMQSPDVIIKIPQIIQLAGKYIRTDMNFYELSQLAGFAKTVRLEDIQTATLPGKPSRYGRTSYWVLDTEKSQAIIDKLIYRDSQPSKDSPLTISILYPKNYAKLNEIKSALEQSGYLVTCDRTSRNPHSEIISHSAYASVDAAKVIREKISDIKDAKFITAPDNYLCGETDFTLVLTNQQ